MTSNFRRVLSCMLPSRLWRWNRQECFETLAYKFQTPGNHPEETRGKWIASSSKLRFCLRCAKRVSRCSHLNVRVCETWPQCDHSLDDLCGIQDRWSFIHKNKTWCSVGGDCDDYRLLVVSPYGLVEIYGRCGGTYYLCLYCCALKMEANVPANRY
jgi:hypothetical protein